MRNYNQFSFIRDVRVKDINLKESISCAVVLMNKIVGLTVLIILLLAGSVNAAILTQTQGITDFKLGTNLPINSTNPGTFSVYVIDDNLESVNLGVVDINNLLSDNLILIGVEINKSGLNGRYFTSWHANSYSITNGNGKEIVTALLFNHPKWLDYYSLPGWFKKNTTTNEEDAFLGFNRTTGNLSIITKNDTGFAPLTIENGISVFKVSKLEFSQGWNKPHIRVIGSTFTLYDIESPNNPYMVSTDVPSGIYRAFVHVVDKNGNNYGNYRDIEVSYNSATPTPTVVITPTSTPTPIVITAYDINGNGRIDKNEAVQAVMDYFSGTITRQDAITVVMAYFSG